MLCCINLFYHQEEWDCTAFTLHCLCLCLWMLCCMKTNEILHCFRCLCLCVCLLYQEQWDQWPLSYYCCSASSPPHPRLELGMIIMIYLSFHKFFDKKMFFFRIFALLGVQFLTRSFIPDIKHLNIYSEFWGFFFLLKCKMVRLATFAWLAEITFTQQPTLPGKKTTSLQTFKYI